VRTTAPSSAVFTRVFSSIAMPCASRTPTVPVASPSRSRSRSGSARVATITVPSAGRPASTPPASRSASWKTAITCGVSTGLLVRIPWPGGAIRTNDFTGVPFFSEP